MRVMGCSPFLGWDQSKNAEDEVGKEKCARRWLEMGEWRTWALVEHTIGEQ